MVPLCSWKGIGRRRHPNVIYGPGRRISANLPCYRVRFSPGHNIYSIIRRHHRAQSRRATFFFSLSLALVGKRRLQTLVVRLLLRCAFPETTGSLRSGGESGSSPFHSPQSCIFLAPHPRPQEERLAFNSKSVPSSGFRIPTCLLEKVKTRMYVFEFQPQACRHHMSYSPQYTTCTLPGRTNDRRMSHAHLLTIQWLQNPRTYPNDQSRKWTELLFSATDPKTTQELESINSWYAVLCTIPRTIPRKPLNALMWVRLRSFRRPVIELTMGEDATAARGGQKGEHLLCRGFDDTKHIEH